jgi:hypothetical protein
MELFVVSRQSSVAGLWAHRGVVAKPGKMAMEALEQRYGSFSTTTFGDLHVAATLESRAPGGADVATWNVVNSATSLPAGGGGG